MLRQSPKKVCFTITNTRLISYKKDFTFFIALKYSTDYICDLLNDNEMQLNKPVAET